MRDIKHCRSKKDIFSPTTKWKQKKKNMYLYLCVVFFFNSLTINPNRSIMQEFDSFMALCNKRSLDSPFFFFTLNGILCLFFHALKNSVHIRRRNSNIEHYSCRITIKMGEKLLNICDFTISFVVVVFFALLSLNNFSLWMYAIRSYNGEFKKKKKKNVLLNVHRTATDNNNDDVDDREK